MSLDHQRRPQGRHTWKLRGEDYLLALVTPLAITVAAVLLAVVARPATRSAPFNKTVQVRLDDDLLQRLERIEDQARGLGRRAFTRSSMIRDAVEAYVAPLASLLDREGKLDCVDLDRLADAPETGRGFSEVTRVRLDDDLVQQLNRVEAYARGLGYRHITRSSLIRDGVSAYLSGFDSELTRNDEDPPDPSSPVGVESTVD